MDKQREEAQPEKVGREIFAWATADRGQESFKYGHLETSRGYGASWRLLTDIDPAMSDSDSLVVFVGNNNEKALYEYEQTL